MSKLLSVGHIREGFIFIKTNKGLIAKDTACSLSVTLKFIMNFHNAFATMLITKLSTVSYKNLSGC